MALATASNYWELTISEKSRKICYSDSGVCAALILTSMPLESRQEDMPWDRWMWNMPQRTAERELNFRKSEDVVIKAPSFECACPPHNECVLEFKINKDMVDFLNVRGVIKNEELKKYSEDLKKFENSSGVYQDTQQAIQTRRNRRSNSKHDEYCCCPPTNVYMPSFITDRKFDKLIDDMKKNNG